MNRIHCLTLSLLLMFSCTQRVHALTWSGLQYFNIGFNIASLAAFVWGISACKGMIEDLIDVSYLTNSSNLQDRDLDRQLKHQKSYLMYLKSIEERLKAAYLLKYTPDELLEVANFTEDERVLAAQLHMLDFEDDFEDDEALSWYAEESESE